MKYIFAKEKLKGSITVEPGGLVLSFSPEEQWLSYEVLKAICQALENSGELSEILSILRVEHSKEEEN